MLLYMVLKNINGPSPLLVRNAVMVGEITHFAAVPNTQVEL